MNSSHTHRFTSKTIALTLAAGLCLGANVAYANPLENISLENSPVEESSSEIDASTQDIQTETDQANGATKTPSKQEAPETLKESSEKDSKIEAALNENMPKESPVQETKIDSVENTAKPEANLKEKSDTEVSEITPESIKQANTVEGAATRETSSLGVSEESTPEKIKSPQSDVVEIKSFDDFKPYLEIKEYRDVSETRKYLTLKAGNYRLSKDISIDTTDSYFSDKSEIIQYGLISVIDTENKKSLSFNFDGSGKTISFGANSAVPLFGLLKAQTIKISNLNIHYLGDVTGFPFVQEISAGSKVSQDGYAEADGLISNVKVRVDGNVNSLRAIERSTASNHYAGKYKGVIATGFSWYLSQVNLEDIDISVAGNIGSNKVPDEPNASAASYGLTWHYSNVRYNKNADGPQGKVWDELHGKRNPKVLYDVGHITNLNINVGGNIQAFTNGAGYTAGIGHDMGEAWIDNAHITIKGDIKTIMSGTTPLNRSISSTHAHGISEEVMNFTNSSLNVNSIIYESDPGLHAEKQKEKIRSIDFARVSALAEDNSKGNYINIKNNTIQVKNGIHVKSSLHVDASPTFINNWSSNTTDGVNWLHHNEKNTYTIGSINILGTGSAQIYYTGFGRRWRTGVNPLGNQDPLPVAELKNNKLTVGKVNVKNPNGDTYIFLMMHNMSNAKNNSAEYEDLIVKSNYLKFVGMGDLSNQHPIVNVYPVLTDRNQLKTGHIKLDTNTAGTIALMFGAQDEKQPLKNCKAIIKSLEVKINSNNSKYDDFIAGICAYSFSDVENCALYVGNINVYSKSKSPLYFGLGTGFAKGVIHSNNRVFVDKDITLKHEGKIWGGGYAGYGKGMRINNTHFQIGGVTNIIAAGGEYGAFAGRLKDCTVSKSSALLLNDYLPFVYGADGGTFDGIAHYINKPVPKFFSGFLARHANNKPIIKNSTLLVEKANQDSVVYRTQNVSDQSANNFVTVVDDSKDGFNRKAYTTKTTTIVENGTPREVVVKSGELVGQINIAKRDFQDKYWNPNIGAYVTGKDEASFDYVDNQDIGKSKLSFFSLPESIILSDVSKAALHNYYNRHAGVFVEGGPVYDLLGIKAITPDPKPQPEPTPSPVPDPVEPNPEIDYERTGFYLPIIKPVEFIPAEAHLEEIESQEALPKTGDSELRSMSTTLIYAVTFLGLTSIAAGILLRKKN